MHYLLQVVTLYLLLSSSVLSLPTLSSAEAGLSVAEVPQSKRIYKEDLSSEVETEGSEEPVFPDDSVEAAETLVFRPHFKYWHNYCVQKRQKLEGRSYPSHQ